MTSGFARVLAPAKVNLFLEVLAKRADGFHEIVTAMLAIDLCDVVIVRRTRSHSIDLAVRGPAASADVPIDASNLAWRAAALALERARAAGLASSDSGLSIELDKRIPSQAGLGGGSSDAAAAWFGAHAALDLPLDPALTRTTLASLGSDCVFFADAAETGFAWCSGRGEVVAPAPPPKACRSIVWIAPAVPASTAAVYVHVSVPTRPRAVPRFDEEMSMSTFNRLESAALVAVPALGEFARALTQPDSLEFVLSGSGSSFFAVCDDDEARSRLDRALERCRAARLAVRGSGIARPSGHGAKLLLDS